MKRKPVPKILLSHAVHGISTALLCFIAFILARVLWSLAADHRIFFAAEFRYITSGFILYFLLHLIIRRKPVLYVLGHELTHVVFVWLFHGWVWRIRIRKTGGSVESTKDNIFISLSPYFFPIYTVAALFLYVLVTGVTKERAVLHAAELLTGATIGFHFAFTVEMLLTRQDDFMEAGRLFSLAFIICLNLAVFSLIAVSLSVRADAELYYKLLKKSLFLFTISLKR